MQITVDEIEAFIAIAQSGSFSKASAQLNRSQPAISRRVSLLEEQLGAPLFKREGRVVTITESGEAFLPYAEAVLASLRDGYRAVEAVNCLDQNVTLSLAIVGTLADSHLVDALRAFEEQRPEVNITISTGTSREVSEMLCRGEATLGLRYFPDHHPNLVSTPVGAEKLFVVVSSAHPMAGKQLPSLTPLGDEKWLGFAKDRQQAGSFGHLLERELTAAGLANVDITTIDSLTAQKRLVQAGFGITLMPLSSIREELRLGSLQIIDVKNLRAEMPVVAIQRKDGFRSEYCKIFLSVLTQHPVFK